MSEIMKVLSFFSKKQREFNTLVISGERVDLYPLHIDFYPDSFVISVSKKDDYLKNLDIDEISIQFTVDSTSKITSCTSYPFDTNNNFTNFNHTELEKLWLLFWENLEDI